MNGRKEGGGRKKGCRLVGTFWLPRGNCPHPRPRWKVGAGSETGRAELRGPRAKTVVFGRAPRFLEVRGKLETSKT